MSSSQQPIIRKSKYIMLLPQIIFLVVITFIFYLLEIKNSFLLGYFTYIIICLGIRSLIPRDHRRGIKFVKELEYGQAIYQFENSYDFFMKHRWIDKYRSIVLLSASRMSYTEMALVNMAFCYSQIGDGLKSKELYENTLIEYPDNQLAISALKLFESAKNIIETETS